MLRLLFGLAMLALAAPLAGASDGYPTPQPGEALVFDVYRQGDTRFGTHEVAFERDGEVVTANITIRLRAGVGPLTVFRYEHDATETWRAGKLLSMTSRTLKDGDTFQVEADAVEDGVAVAGVEPEGNRLELIAPASILSSSHWHGYPDDMSQMLNTEHGTLMDTQVQYLGQTTIEGDGGMIEVSHYRLASTLIVDLYYDANGRWAGCSFDARGQQVRYVRRANPVRT